MSNSVVLGVGGPVGTAGAVTVALAARKHVQGAASKAVKKLVTKTMFRLAVGMIFCV